MSLKIIFGRSGCGKSTFMLNNIKPGSDTIYIVPEQFSFSAEKKLIEKFGVVGLGNPQVLSFMRLADLVFSKYGSPDFIADIASYEMLVCYCANSIVPDKLRLFDGLVRKSELAQTASSLITTFKKYCISTEKLEYAIENVDDELLQKKLSDSLTIYKRYTEELNDAKVSDRNDALGILANILSDDDCDYLNGKSVCIDQFTDFDPSEYECIKAMLLHAESVTIALCADDDLQFETVNRTYRKLVNLAKELSVRFEEITLSGSMIGAKPMIKHLEKCYFEDETAPFCGTDGSIELFAFANRNTEIHNVAKNIVRLVRDENLRYRDISVIARDAEIYKSITERIFPLYNIPSFIDRKLPLSGHSITLFVTSVLDIAVTGFSYENVFSFIKSPFSPLTTEEADELENYCLATGIRPYAWSKPFTAEYGAYNPQSDMKSDSLTEEKITRINGLRERVYLPLNALIKKLKTKSTVKECCAYLFDYFELIELEKKIRKSALELESRGENLYALQTMQVYNILVEIFNDLCTVLGDKTLTLNEFRTTISAGLKAVEVGTIPSSGDCVTVGSIDRIKGHGAKAVFLVGVNSGVFPLSPSENGLFSDEDKKVLEGLGIEMPPTLSHLVENEQMLIYDALTCAGEKLYISYPLSDNGTNALMPSEIVDRIRTIFPDVTYTDDLITKVDFNSITAKKAVFDLVVSGINELYTEGKALSPEISAAAYYFSQDAEYAHLLQQALEMTTYSGNPSRISRRLIKKAIGEEMKTSITRLETYNKCPFSFFARYILKLEPRETFEVTTSDSGSFLHDFLDRFSALIINSVDANGKSLTWKTIDNDFIKMNTPVVLKEVLSSVNSRMLEIPRIKALFDRLCRSAENSVYSVRRHIIKSDFVPMGYEITFDEDGNFKPTQITLDDGITVTLRGRIDRADEFESGNGKFVRVVDYKSSEKTLSLSDVYRGVQLQLFVYLSNLCDNGYKPAGILYCNISDPIVEVSPQSSEDEILRKRFDELKMNGIILSDDGMLDHMGGTDILKSKKSATAKDFNNMFTHLKKLIKKTAQNIYNGDFPIICNKDNCTWCEYAQLCRAEAYTENLCAPKTTLKDEEIWTMLEETENGMDN